MSEVDIAIAFAAGVVSFFSPCSVSVLPAFIAYFVGRREDGTPNFVREGGPPGVFLIGLLLSLVGVGIAVGALAHNFVDLDRNRIFDVLYGLIGLAVLTIGLSIFAMSRASMDPSERTSYLMTARRGLTFGGFATLGFAVVYAGIGLLVVLPVSGLGVLVAGSLLRGTLPWVSLITAFFLVALGVLLALDMSPFKYIPVVRSPSARNALSFLLFGSAYALVSTSCLLPVFLSVLARAIVLSVPEAVIVFLAMAGGSGLLMTVTATYVAFSKHTAIRHLLRFRRYMNPVAGVLVALFALYTVYYDLTTFFDLGM